MTTSIPRLVVDSSVSMTPEPSPLREVMVEGAAPLPSSSVARRLTFPEEGEVEVPGEEAK